jgi:hypothetical protein
MDFQDARTELKTMDRGSLFRLAAGQRISRCLIGAVPCPLYFHFKNFGFCVSEILGKSCQVEKADVSQTVFREAEEAFAPLPLLGRPETVPFQIEKTSTSPRFRVYFRNEADRSILHLGDVIERRTRERGNNLRDLLGKAVRDYGHRVSDPSMIFLMAHE